VTSLISDGNFVSVARLAGDGQRFGVMLAQLADLRPMPMRDRFKHVNGQI
jgi:hypothetical protein